jgi:hypothetical protein
MANPKDLLEAVRADPERIAAIRRKVDLGITGAAQKDDFTFPAQSGVSPGVTPGAARIRKSRAEECYARRPGTGSTAAKGRSVTTARETFELGQRVRLTAHGVASCPRRWDALGTVVGFGHQPYLVTILRDGRKTRESYHMDFWEPIEAP